jgi:Domain of unknown function (DUF5668)
MNDIIRTTPASEGPARISAVRLVFGIVLVAIGVLAFADSIDLLSPRELHRYWPVFLLVIGIGMEADTFRTRQEEHGYIPLALGLWFLAASTDFLGLTYRTAFPIGVAVTGLGMIVHALLGVDGKKEKKS